MGRLNVHATEEQRSHGASSTAYQSGSTGRVETVEQLDIERPFINGVFFPNSSKHLFTLSPPLLLSSNLGDLLP
jgi:hypothetical protein